MAAALFVSLLVIDTAAAAAMAPSTVCRGLTPQPPQRRVAARLRTRVRAVAGEVPANDPRGVTGRYSVFAPNATETVTVCEFRAELKKNLGEFRTRGSSEERHERYQATTSYLDALTSKGKGAADVAL